MQTRDVTPGQAHLRRPAVRIALGPSGWILAMPPPGPVLTPELALAAATGLAAGLDPAPHAPFAIIRAARIDERLGRAVLVTRFGRAVLYCPAGEITGQAATGLTALACAAARIPWPGPQPAPVRIQVTRDPHPDLLLPGRHPAYLHARPAGTFTAHVCANLISAELAADLSALGAALPVLAQPRA